jgi:hypothetical protein
MKKRMKNRKSITTVLLSEFVLADIQPRVLSKKAHEGGLYKDREYPVIKQVHRVKHMQIRGVEDHQVDAPARDKEEPLTRICCHARYAVVQCLWVGEECPAICYIPQGDTARSIAGHNRPL